MAKLRSPMHASWRTPGIARVLPLGLLALIPLLEILIEVVGVGPFLTVERRERILDQLIQLLRVTETALAVQWLCGHLATFARLRSPCEHPEPGSFFDEADHTLTPAVDTSCGFLVDSQGHLVTDR